MKVLKFSIGFGPKLIKRQKGETEYSLRVLPLGGFVQLDGEDEESNDPRSFSKRPIWQRLLVLLAGVTMNILIALVIYLSIYMNINDYITTRISGESDEQAKIYGFTVGDEITKVNGHKVYNSDDVYRIVESSKEDNIKFTLLDANQKEYSKDILIPKKAYGYIGVVFERESIYQVLKDGAGEEAGLKAKDQILSIEGESGDIYLYLNYIQENPNKELDFVVLRNGQEVELKVTPKERLKRTIDLEFIEIKDLDFFHNLLYAWKETKYYLRANFIGIAELLSGKTENVEVEGIVGISKQISNTQTFIEFFYLMSAISLSLGIMNLLPIPGLDGGKILLTLIELVRRKPISKETEAKITLIGFAFLLLLMIIITMSDLSKL